MIAQPEAGVPFLGKKMGMARGKEAIGVGERPGEY